MTEEREPEQLSDDELEGLAEEGDGAEGGEGGGDGGPDVTELDEDPAYNADGPAGDLKGG